MRRISTRMSRWYHLFVITALCTAPTPLTAIGLRRLSAALVTLTASQFTDHPKLHDNLTIVTGTLVTSVLMDLGCEKVRPPKWEVENHNLLSFTLKLGSWISLIVGTGIIIDNANSI